MEIPQTHADVDQQSEKPVGDLHITLSGEAVHSSTHNNIHDKYNSEFAHNPFMKMSDNRCDIDTYSEEALLNAHKNWKSMLTNIKTNPKQKKDIFLQDFLNVILPPINYPTHTHTNHSNDDESKEQSDSQTQQSQQNADIDIDTDEDADRNRHAYGFVSHTQSTREELLQMTSQFDSLIIERRARKSGLDNSRTQLAFQLFDEVIRQISIDSKERALLLLRIRDEAKMTLTSYAILRSVSSQFSTNMSEKGSGHVFDELQIKKAQLLVSKQALKEKMVSLNNELRDKEKEVVVLEKVQQTYLLDNKRTVEKENEKLRALIDKKSRTGQNRRKSLKNGKRLTRRCSVHASVHGSVTASKAKLTAFSFGGEKTG